MHAIHVGNSLEVLRTFADNTFDAIITDPPYELGFMGKKWDSSGIAYNVDLWRECLRVLKPGGHLAAFGGTRTYHRMACAIEDAGFEIRDCMQWLYGSGFPKSLDVSKAIDKAAGAEREVVATVKKLHFSGSDLDTHEGWSRPSHRNPDGTAKTTMDITAPATDAAKQWQGWGTALKPAHEPITLARKPLSEGTVAANVLKWGCGAVNVDAGRIPTDDNRDRIGGGRKGNGEGVYGDSVIYDSLSNPAGRWPANVLLDEEAAAMLDAQTGTLKSGELKGYEIPGESANGHFIGKAKRTITQSTASSGGASRFFYCAKASRKERNAGCEHLPERDTSVGDRRPSGSMSQRIHADEGRPDTVARNNHPTVKPIALMHYLCTLLCPPNGHILDPFTGSGTTACAAVPAGFGFTGIELNPEYAAIAEARVAYWSKQAA